MLWLCLHYLSCRGVGLHIRLQLLPLGFADEDMQNAHMNVPEEASDGTVASGKHGLIGDWLLSLEASAGTL